jgi:hypothetical protein
MLYFFVKLRKREEKIIPEAYISSLTIKIPAKARFRNCAEWSGVTLAGKEIICPPRG